MKNSLITKLNLGRRFHISLGTVFIAFILTGIAGYRLGQERWNISKPSPEATTVEQYKHLEHQHSDLKRRFTQVERNYQIQLEAKKNLVQHLKSLQHQNSELTNKLSLYQTLAGMQFAQQSIKVKSFKAFPTGSPQTFRYWVILNKEISGKDLIQGSVGMTIIGKIGTQSVLLPVKYVNSSRQDGLAFSFRHFQELHGELTFPDHFVPHEIMFKITPDKGAAVAEQKVDWLLVA